MEMHDAIAAPGTSTAARPRPADLVKRGIPAGTASACQRRNRRFINENGIPSYGNASAERLVQRRGCR
jgi:hypothetical protein